MNKDNPKDTADYLVQEYGLDEAIKVAMESTTTADNNYDLSVWREVKAILKERRDLPKAP